MGRVYTRSLRVSQTKTGAQSVRATDSTKFTVRSKQSLPA